MKSTLDFIVLTFITFLACDSKPKVIVADEKTETSTLSNTDQSSEAFSSTTSDVHQVVIGEILNTERYTYAEVTENQEKFWIAVPKQELVKGHTYYYRGGLKKTNFQSQEFNRVFDVVYLVSNIIDSKEHPGGNLGDGRQAETAPSSEGNTKPVAGSIKLSELMKNKSKYAGKTILISGQCVKANYQIMGKNWFHIQDGSEVAGKKSDLTVTTSDAIQMGEQAAFEGKIVLNKDFGAGYKYEIIMEDALLKK